MLTLNRFNYKYKALLENANKLLIRARAKDGLSDVDALRVPALAEMMQDASLQPDTERLKKDIHQLFVDLNIEGESPWKRQDPGGLCRQDESYFGDLKLCQQSLRMLNFLSNAGNVSSGDLESQLQGSLGECIELGYNIQPSFYSPALPSNYKFREEDLAYIKDGFIFPEFHAVVYSDNTDLYRCFKRKLSSHVDPSGATWPTRIACFLVSMIGSKDMLKLVIEDINKKDSVDVSSLLEATYSLYEMREYSCKGVFREDNFDYLVEIGAKPDINTLMQAMIFAANAELPNDKEKYDEIFRKIIEVGELSGKLDEIAVQARVKKIDSLVIDSVSEICRELDGPSPSFR